MRTLFATLGIVLFASCLPWEDDGVYACDTDTGKDCVFCDLDRGWCRDITAIAAGANILFGISGVAGGAEPDSVWAVGSNGVIVRWNGERWILQESGTSAMLNAVWASDKNDVMAVGGNGTYVHYNGAGWTSFTDAALASLGNDFTAVGGNKSKGLMWAADGAANVFLWPQVSYPPTDRSASWDYFGSAATVASLWGVFVNNSPGDSYFVGEQGKVYRELWTPTVAFGTDDISPAGLTENLYSAWGNRSSGEFWAVGEGGSIFYWNGSSFLDESLPPGEVVALYAIAGAADTSNDLWVVGTDGYIAHNDGSGWVKETYSPTTDLITNVFVTPDYLYLVTGQGEILYQKR